MSIRCIQDTCEVKCFGNSGGHLLVYFRFSKTFVPRKRQVLEWKIHLDLYYVILARYDPFGVDVPLNFDITHSLYYVIQFLCMVIVFHLVKQIERQAPGLLVKVQVWIFKIPIWA